MAVRSVEDSEAEFSDDSFGDVDSLAGVDRPLSHFHGKTLAKRRVRFLLIRGIGVNNYEMDDSRVRKNPGAFFEAPNY